MKGPPVETIKLEAELDATDGLGEPKPNPDTVRLGLHRELAALETIVYPRSERLLANNALARSGTLEIIPAQAPLTLFVWSRSRIVPVRRAVERVDRVLYYGAVPLFLARLFFRS